MSLIYWWPLNENNNLHDKINNTLLTNNSSTFTTTGKIGGAYYFNGSNNCKLHCPWPSNIQGDTISVAFWIKLESNWSGWGQVFTIGKEGTDWKDIRFGIDIQSDRIVRFSISDGSNATSYNGPYNSAISTGVWYHIAAIYDNGLMRLYINGNPANQLHSYSITITPNFSGTKINIGGNSSEAGECTINDVRIYNHALSKKEVQELSRALVFHYTFDGGMGEETTNLLPVSLQNKYVENVADAASYTITSGLGASSYTLFANIRCGTNDNSPTPYFSLFADYSDGTSERLTTSTSLDGTSLTTAKDNQFHPYQLTVENPQRKTVTKLYGWLLDRGSYNGQARYMTIQNAQLEAKDHATAFTSSTRAGQPKNNTGLVHNTMENQGVVFCKDTQRHSVGYFKTGGQQLIYTGLSGYESALTTSMWFKSSNKNPLDGYHILLSIDDGSVEISIPANGQLRYGGYPSSGSRVCNNHSVTVGGKSVNLIDGQWHLINTVFDGTGWLGYVDGEYQTKWSMTSNVRRVNGTLRIGKYTSAATYGATDAYMDDVRLYNTALSASDIKQLYELSWAANQQGQVFSNVINENQSAHQITRGGVVNCKKLNETPFPSGYQRIEYIQSTGSSYIDTGIAPGTALRFHTVISDVSGSAYIITQGNYGLRGYSNTFTNFVSGRRFKGSISITSGIRYIISGSNDGVWINGVAGVQETDNDSPTGNVRLMASGSGKMYECMLWNDDTLVRAFVPVIAPDGTPCMYDYVTKRCYGSPTDTAFTAGDNIISKVQYDKNGNSYCNEFNEI